MLRARLAFAVVLYAAVASAHSVVDIGMSFDVPHFVAAQTTFTYHVIADDRNNDNGLGIVVTIVLPPSVKFSKATSTAFRCSESKLTLTCSADTVSPGPNPIDVTVTAPATPGIIRATANTQSLGSLDLTPQNDNATADVVIYDAGACRASAPLLVGPPDEASQPAVVQLSWSAVDGAQSYSVFTSVEGAAAAPMLVTDKTSAALVAEPGRSEWWVEATFNSCPPQDSEHRHFTADSVLQRNAAVYAGDPSLAATKDGPRSSATFKAPYGLALSPQNDLYVTDETDNVVRAISHDNVTTIAGAPGFTGATEGQFARFNGLRGVAVTPLDGYVFVADAQNQEVRILYTGGPFIPAFVVGGGALLAGNVDDVGDKSRFNQPSGIAATLRGNLYVADTQNNAIRKMTQVPGAIGLFTTTTFARGLHGPLGVAVDANENVYVADTEDNTITKIVNGIVNVFAGQSGVAGGRDGRSPLFDHPAAIALDARGNLYVADRNGIRRIAPTGLTTTVARTTGTGIVVDADRVFVADPAAHVIRVLDPATAPLAPAPGGRRRAAH
jgi:sugar lactone lactonase YvrE